MTNWHNFKNINWNTIFKSICKNNSSNSI